MYQKRQRIRDLGEPAPKNNFCFIYQFLIGYEISTVLLLSINVATSMLPLIKMVTICCIADDSQKYY